VLPLVLVTVLALLALVASASTTTYTIETVTVGLTTNLTLPTATFEEPRAPREKPGLFSPEGLILLALFAALFIAYSKVMSVGQALTVSSAIGFALSLILFGNEAVILFVVGFAMGIALWRVLGR